MTQAIIYHFKFNFNLYLTKQDWKYSKLFLNEIVRILGQEKTEVIEEM